jgi:hypothetical protein
MNAIRYLLAVLLGATLTALISLIVFSNRSVPVERVPLEWVTDTFPQNVEVCPGESVPYVLAISEKVTGVVTLYDTIDRAPNHPDVEAVRNTELVQMLILQHGVDIVGDTVQIEQSPSWVILGGDDRSGIGLRVDIDSTLVIPENLEPGPYIRKLAVVWEGRPSDASIRIQKFTIKPEGDCQ